MLCRNTILSAVRPIDFKELAMDDVDFAGWRELSSWPSGSESRGAAFCDVDVCSFLEDLNGFSLSKIIFSTADAHRRTEPFYMLTYSISTPR